MPGSSRRLPPILTVTLPVVLAAMLVCLALLNIASVRTWRGEPEDGVLWKQQSGGGAVVAAEVAKASAGERAGIQPGDVLILIDGHEVQNVDDVTRAAESALDGHE